MHKRNKVLLGTGFNPGEPQIAERVAFCVTFVKLGE